MTKEPVKTRRLPPYTVFLAALLTFPLLPPAHAARADGPLQQGPAIQVFDTSPIPGGPYYVNDHTFIQGTDGSWHLYGIFHHEPFGSESEFDFVDAATAQSQPALWNPQSFTMLPGAQGIALHADRSIGETHVWAPHVVRDITNEGANPRYLMVYQGGGPENDRASIRMATSTDLVNWKRVSDQPLFEDVCVARDPMLRWQAGLKASAGPAGSTGQWVLYYTRCDSTASQHSGVAYRTSADLVHWSAPQMALTLPDSEPMFNSGYTESPFVFERGGWYYLSVTSYPIDWVATQVFRSRTPYAFPSTPYARLEAHAAEWIFTPPEAGYPEGRAWLSHCGAGQSGVYLSPVTGF